MIRICVLNDPAASWSEFLQLLSNRFCCISGSIQLLLWRLPACAPETRWKHDPSSLCQTSAEEWVSGTTLLPAAGSVLIGSENSVFMEHGCRWKWGEGLFLKEGPGRQALQVASPRFKQSSSTLQFPLSRRVSAKEGTRHASHNEPHSCCHRF